jgi:DNA-binding HxlR family transcriptional regulator
MPKQEKNNPQTIMNSLCDLQTEVKTLRAELNRIEGSLLKERVKAVEQALSQNRLMLYAKQMQDELGEDLNEIVNTQCQNRQKCIETFRTIATENLNVAQEANPESAIADLDSKISKIVQTAEKTKGEPCGECHQNFQKKLKRQKRAIQTIVLIEKSPENPDNEQININHLVKTVLEPLANSSRLKIFLSIYEGKKSFSKLAQISNLRGGHLIFHLKKLLDSGLIVQEDNKGDYVITQNGAGVIQKIFLFQ